MAQNSVHLLQYLAVLYFHVLIPQRWNSKESPHIAKLAGDLCFLTNETLYSATVVQFSGSYFAFATSHPLVWVHNASGSFNQPDRTSRLCLHVFVCCINR